jgi:hypothetical protein
MVKKNAIANAINASLEQLSITTLGQLAGVSELR